MMSKPACYWSIYMSGKSTGKAKTKNMFHVTYRGSNMNAHVLLNLLNQLGKRDKM